MYVIRIYSKNMMKIHFPNTCDFRVKKFNTEFIIHRSAVN